MKTFGILGALAGFLGVAVGAFGAHALRESMSSQMQTTFETGVRYQMYHALALFAVAWLVDRYDDVIFYRAGWLFLTGIILFSGSLYLLALTNSRWLGAITPFGGLAFLGGWALVAYGLFTRP